MQDGRNGLPVLALTHPAGSSAELYLHGAHLTSWVPAGGVEALFLSRAAEFAPGKAIRGGVPVVFPQFAQRGPLPKHGFARVLPWRWVDPHGDATRATLELVDTEETRALWPYPFRARLSVELGERSLSQRLSVENTGTEELSFTTALHSYFAVGELSGAAVEGLAGTAYEEGSARGRAPETEGGLGISGELDRVYLDAPAELRLRDAANARTISLRLDGFGDVVVWNPGEKGASALPDMEGEEHRRMVCVEAARIGRPVTLAPGKRWEGGQRLEVADTRKSDLLRSAGEG